MSRVRSRLPRLCGIALLLAAASACGQSTRTSAGPGDSLPASQQATAGSTAPTGNPDSRTTASRLVVTSQGQTHTEWYAGNGWWSTSRSGPGGGSLAMVYDGTRYVQRAGAQISVVSGIPDYVRAEAQPLFDFSPGIGLLRAYQAHEMSGQGFTMTASTQGGSTVLDAVVPYDTDTQTLKLRFHVVVSTMSLAAAEAAGAFKKPSGAPSATEVGGTPGAASTIDLPSYWFGPTLDRRTARISIQQHASARAAAAARANGDGDQMRTQYLTVYRKSSESSHQGTGPWSGYPGIGNIPPGDVYVINVANGDPYNELTLNAATADERTATPVTLTDGEQATLYTWANRVAAPTGGAFVVKTATTTVEVNYIGSTSLRKAERLVRLLRPVG